MAADGMNAMMIGAMVLFAIGGLVSLVGGIWLLVVAFQEHILWGLGSLLVPFVSLIFVIMYWNKSWKPFGLQLVGVLVSVGGFLLILPSLPAPQ